MMVTTGGRETIAAGSSVASNRPSSTSDSATRLTEWPISSARSCAVSASITSVIFTIWPCRMSRRMTSTPRSAMRLASSWIVMVSGMITSRTSFSLGSVSRWPAMRCTRRRNDATERSRTSSALSAVTTVRRPRRFSPVTFAGLGAGGGRMAPPPRAGGGAPPPPPTRAPARPRSGRGVLAETLFGLLLGLELGLLVVALAILFAPLARLGGLALGALGGLARDAHMGLLLGDLALLGLAQASVGQRMHARFLLVLGQRAQHDARGLRGGDDGRLRRHGRGRRRLRHHRRPGRRGPPPGARRVPRGG